MKFFEKLVAALEALCAKLGKEVPENLLAALRNFGIWAEKTAPEVWAAFATSPASTRWHGAYSGGLLEHSVALCYYLFTRTLSGGARPEQTVFLSTEQVVEIGMFHDLCKVGLYHQTETGYAYNEGIVQHHALRSLGMAEDMLNEELPSWLRVSILLHMAGGFWNMEDEAALTNADRDWLAENLSTVSAVQWADMKAC